MHDHFMQHPMGLAHFAVSLLAVALGGAVLLARKGTQRHRWLGRAYVAAMLSVNVTALSIYELFGGFGAFHWMALLSLAVVVLGWVPARRRTPGWRVRHAYFMAGSYVGLIAALVSETTTRLNTHPIEGLDAFPSSRP